MLPDAIDERALANFRISFFAVDDKNVLTVKKIRGFELCADCLDDDASKYQ
jgi:hypothetical protein